MPISNIVQVISNNVALLQGKPVPGEPMAQEVTAICKGENITRKNGSGVRDFISSRPRKHQPKYIHHQKERGSTFVGTALARSENKQGRAGSTGGDQKKSHGK